MPISRVRSDTDMIMVLAMPIAATKNDTAPMPPKASWMPRDCFSISLRVCSNEEV